MIPCVLYKLNYLIAVKLVFVEYTADTAFSEHSLNRTKNTKSFLRVVPIHTYINTYLRALLARTHRQMSHVITRKRTRMQAAQEQHRPPHVH